MLAAVPSFDDAMVNPPGMEWPRLCCFFFFKGDSIRPDHFQATRWCVPRLRVLYYSLNKEYSRKIFKLAIPQLLNEINILRDPEQAAQRFRSLVMDPGVLLASMFMARMKVGDGEEPFEQYIERLQHLPNTKEEGLFTS